MRAMQSAHTCTLGVVGERKLGAMAATLLLSARALLLPAHDAWAAPASLLAMAAFHLRPPALWACWSYAALLALPRRLRMSCFWGPARLPLARMIWLLLMRLSHLQ
jgi:hypothetical protein